MIFYKSSKIQASEEVEEEPETEVEEKIDFEHEIEIGDLRGLEEDERIIIVPPKEESTVEADGEDFDDQNEETDSGKYIFCVGLGQNGTHYPF